MPRITNCLWFDGQAQAAAELYVSLFPNSRVKAVHRYGPDEPGAEGSVVSVAFELDGTPFVGIDGGPQFPHSEAISFQVDCADQAEIDHYWDGLVADGGQESRCGWLKDRFGVSWQIVPARLEEWMAADPQTASRVTQAFLPMSRLDLATLEKAAAG